MIKAVIFDLDGVIVRTDDLHYRAWKFVADQEGIIFNQTINHRLRGVSRMESLEIILEQSNKTYLEEEKLKIATIKNNYYMELLKNLNESDILPGVLFVLNALKQKGIKIAIGSSSRNTPMILKQIGLDQAFDAIADGNDVKNSKPAPDVFIRAAERLNIEPRLCAVVEDAEAGIEAAKHAKMISIAISDARKSPKADYRLEKITELLSIV